MLQLLPLIGKAAAENSLFLSLSPVCLSVRPSRISFQSVAAAAAVRRYLLAYLTEEEEDGRTERTPSLFHSFTVLSVVKIIHPNSNDLKPQ